MALLTHLHRSGAAGLSAPRLADRAAQVGVSTLLLGALVALGAAPSQVTGSYSWIEHGVSESAGQGVDGAWLARSGFVLFGLAVVWLVIRRAQAWGVVGRLLHLGFGVSMLAVAAFSSRSWDPGAAYVASEDHLHSFFATTMGFGFIGGVLAVMAVRPRRSLRALAPDLATVVLTSVIPLAMSSSVWGVLQRAMFLAAAAWYGREAWTRAGGDGAAPLSARASSRRGTSS